MVPIAVLASAGIAGCSSGAPPPAPTVTVTATVTATATAATTITAKPTEPEVVPTPTAAGTTLGLIWASQVDPARVNQPAGTQPVFDGGDGLASRIEMIRYVDSRLESDSAYACRDAISFSGEADDTHCLHVQWSFDVPADYDADDAGLSPGTLLTSEGKQITNHTVEVGVPGAKNVVVVIYYPGGEPGATLRWDMGSNEYQWKTLKYEVPELASFLPTNFD